MLKNLKSSVQFSVDIPVSGHPDGHRSLLKLNKVSEATHLLNLIKPHVRMSTLNYGRCFYNSCICIIFTSEILCNTNHILYILIQSFWACRSEEHTSELQSRFDIVCRLLLEKKKVYTHSN